MAAAGECAEAPKAMMTDTFDPYQKWLGIPPQQQPPNPYRLLAIELFENDPDVIEHAADRQMAYLRTFQAGKHSDACQTLLNEVAGARFSLLDAQQKSAIDRRLKAALAATPPGPVPLAQPRSLAEAGPTGRSHDDQAIQPTLSSPPEHTKNRRKSRSRDYPTARPLEPRSPHATGADQASSLPASSLPASGPSVGGPARPIPLTTVPKPSTLAAAQPLRTGVVATRRKAARGVWLEAAKVAVGGLAGIGIGLLILWLVFRQDPAGLASSVPRKNDDAPARVDPAQQQQHASTSPAEPPAPDDVDPFVPLEPGTRVSSEDGLQVERPSWLPPLESPVYGVRDVPDYSLEDLGQAIVSATEVAPIADRLFSDVALSPDEQKRLARQMHAEFCRLADVITFADFGQAPVQMHLANVERLLLRIGDSPQKLKAIGFAAHQRWQEASPESRGILLAGSIEQIRAERQLYVTQLRLASSDETLISVYSWKDPAMFCKPGDSALVLGHIVDNPSDNLAGYEGQDPRVVWGGYLVTPNTGPN